MSSEAQYEIYKLYWLEMYLFFMHSTVIAAENQDP